jgi:hypothetical protein
MSCLGVHFALTEEEVNKLESIEDEQARLTHLVEEIEQRYFEEPKSYIAESDKSWDAMHRALSDGMLTWTGGTYPLNHTVLGGKRLYLEDDYIISLKSPEQVRDIAKALAPISESNFRSLYNNINAQNYDGALSEEDFEYTWGWFQGVRDLYAKAAIDGRFILFTADQ